jgi:HAD superfamily hydrolase (TIGR01509 family)
MSFPRPVKAVIFDMDGLLVDTEQVVFAAMRHAAAGLGREIPFEIFQRMVGLTHAKSDLILVEHFGEGFDLEAFQAEVSTFFRAEQTAGIALKAGAVEILDQLDAMALPRAIATSSSRYAVEQSLGPHGLLGRFGAFITRDVQEQGKPHPEPFLKAAAALGINPADCLALEDSHNGVRSASSAGMMTVMVPDMLDPTEEMETLTVRIATDLHEVAALLAAQT